MVDQRRLAALLSRHYGIEPTAIADGPRGTVAETYIVDSGIGRHFAKLIPISYYSEGIVAALPIHLALFESGIDQVGRPIATVSGDLSVRLERHVMVVLAYLEGDWTETYPYDDFVELIARVHTSPLDIPGERETFTDTNLEIYERRLEDLLSGSFRDPIKRELQHSVRPRVPLLRRRAATYRRLMGSLARLRDVPMVLTHHDAPGNVLLGEDGRIRIVDWDDVMWAPRERDTWVHVLTPADEARFLASYRRWVPDYVPDERFVAFYLHGWYFEELEMFFDRVLDPRSSPERRSEALGWYRDRMDWLEEGLRLRETLAAGQPMS